VLNLKEYLQDFADGNIEWHELISSIEKNAGSSLDSAQSVLSQLDEIYDLNFLDRNTIELLKKSVLGAITNQGPENSRLDLDFSIPEDSSALTMANPAVQPTSQSQSKIEIKKGFILRERFVIDELLGVGGMGSVYKGRDLLKVEAKDRNPYVAIKVLNENVKDRSDAFIALQREASRQQRLAHPNIATVYDFDRVNNLIFITMELLEGKPLDEYLKKVFKYQGGLPKEEAFRIIRGLSEALKYAHEHQITHSDFKPSNCFFRNDGAIKVLDFGIARAIRKSDDEHHTLFDGQDMGAMTPAYASLEMLEKSADPDPSDDVYALGCVAYEILAGKHPFNRLPANTAAENKLNILPIPSLSRKENRAIMHALAFKRGDRTSSVDVFLQELLGEDKSSRKYGFYIAIDAGIIAIAVAIVVGMYFYKEHRMETIIVNISTGDPDMIQQGLDTMKEIDNSRRVRVLSRVNEKLSGYFENQIMVKVRGLDFLTAESLVATARNYYPDSARIETAAQKLIEEKGRVLGTLGEQYDLYLRERRLMPDGDGKDLPAVIEQLKKVDPQNKLLTDVRLANVYSEQARELITDKRLDDAQKLINIGKQLAPENVALVNAQDLLTSENQKSERQASINQLLTTINDNLTDPVELVSIKPVENQILHLSSLDNNNPVLIALASKLSLEINQRLKQLANNPTLNAIELYRSNYKALFTAMNFNTELNTLDKLYETTSSELERLMNNMADDIALGNLDTPENNNAVTRLETLEKIIPGDPRIEQYRGQIINAYLNKARDQRLAGQWATARQKLSLAENLGPSATLKQQLQQELQNITDSERNASNQKLAEEKKNTEQQRLAAITELEGEAVKAAKDTRTPADARKVLQLLNRLQDMNPASPLLQSVRDQTQGKLAAAIIESGGNTGDWRQALAMIEQSESLFTDSSALNKAKIQIQDAIKKAESSAKQQQIDDLKSQLMAAVVNIPELPDNKWTDQTSQTIKELFQILPANDTWLDSTRKQIIEHYLEQAAKLRATQRFALAGQILGRAEKIAPGSVALASEKTLLNKEQKAFQIKQTEQGKLARIESYKQTFDAYISAKNITKAEDTLTLLSKELPENDPFLRDEAPKTLAKTYYQLAMAANDSKHYQTAVDYAKAGLLQTPDDKLLANLKESAQIDIDSEEITGILKNSDTLNASQLKGRIADLLRRSRNKSNTLQSEWVKSLQQRLQGIRDKDSTKYNEMLAAAQEIFPDSKQLSALQIIKTQSVPAQTTLAGTDIYGNWCSQGIKLTLASNEMNFHLENGADVKYPITKYDFTSANVSITWTDNQGNGMLTEFSDFNNDKSKMTQKRGREVRSSSWNDYNRPFNRCN